MKTTTVRNTIVMVLASATFAFAQQTGFPCGSSEYNELLRQKYPVGVQEADRQLQAQFQNLRSHGAESSATATFVIPVVFHIIHDYGPENITDAQVLNEMMILNRDYAMLNPDTTNVIPQFQNIKSATDIEFRLATIDPEGNCTNGIERIASKKTNNANDDSKLNPWPRNKYLNVWVVKTIGAAGVAGYAYYPSGVQGPGMIYDGVLILSSYIGSIGTGSPGTSRALTHEVGHYLNLSHPWGSTNDPGVACGDDGIPDTPETKGWDHCPTPAQAKVCDTAVVENYQNYMDYSYCSIMFTHDQAVSMRATLMTSIAGRDHLSLTSNLIATGTYVIAPSACRPYADFHANHIFTCEGGTIQYTDNSWNGTVTNRTWNFPGGTPSTSTTANPTITYNTAGQYPVTLTVSNVNGADSVTKFGYAIVGTSYGEAIAPIVESFEDPNVLNHGWYILNNNSDAMYWHQTNATGYTGTSCLVMDNYNNGPGEVDEIASPQYDLRFLTGMTMTFKLAFASKTSNTTLLTDKLRVLASTNCGQSWAPVYSGTGVQLVSAGLNPGYFIPSNNPQEWRTITFNVSNAYAQSRVRFKFELTGSSYGNQLYIDDINITGTGVGIAEQPGPLTFYNAFPNPSTGNSNLMFNMDTKEHLNIGLTDLNGRLVKEIANEEFGAGEHTVPFSTEGIAPGIYFITVDNGTNKQVMKFAVSH